VSGAVAYHYDSGETSDTTTLHGFGNTVDYNELVLQFKLFYVEILSHVNLLD
jgi:hypothetical protein